MQKLQQRLQDLNNATGSDARGFCAAPSHALIEAAALVKSGAYKCVAVTAGGCTAKLGMNGKDHIKKGLPILEDCLWRILCNHFAENDGVNPRSTLICLDAIQCRNRMRSTERNRKSCSRST